MLDFLVFLFGISGALLLINKNKLGFLSFCIHSSIWGYLSILAGNYWSAFTCLIFICIDAYGYRKWTKDELLLKLAEEGQAIESQMPVSTEVKLNAAEFLGITPTEVDRWEAKVTSEAFNIVISDDSLEGVIEGLEDISKRIRR